jgi:putative acetyltransferase
MLTLRTERPSDVPAVAGIHRLAFGGDAEPSLVNALRGTDAFVPELSIVAEQDGAPVGHLLFTRVTIQAPSGEVPALALAPLAVLPALQRKGVGSALMREGLARARALGHGLVLVLGHPEYYARFGFVRASEHGLRCRWPVPDEVYRVLELRPGALQGVSGEVIYAAPFNAV